MAADLKTFKLPEGASISEFENGRVTVRLADGGSYSMRPKMEANAAARVGAALDHSRNP